MRELEERVSNLELNTQEPQLPDTYITKAKELVEKRKKDEENLRRNLQPINGTDDRLSAQLFELDKQLRKDITDLRKEYNLN